MDFHEINSVGPIYIERVDSLPSFQPEFVGRLVHNYSDGNVYYGYESGWFGISASGGTGGVYTFSFTCPQDPDDDAVGVELQIDSNPDFSNIIIDVSTYSSENNWYLFDGSNWILLSNVVGSGTIPAGYQGNRVAYKIQNSNINSGQIYFCRFRVSDDGGTTWSDWAGEVVSW